MSIRSTNRAAAFSGFADKLGYRVIRQERALKRRSFSAHSLGTLKAKELIGERNGQVGSMASSFSKHRDIGWINFGRAADKSKWLSDDGCDHVR